MELSTNMSPSKESGIISPQRFPVPLLPSAKPSASSHSSVSRSLRGPVAPRAAQWGVTPLKSGASLEAPVGVRRRVASQEPGGVVVVQASASSNWLTDPRCSWSTIGTWIPRPLLANVLQVREDPLVLRTYILTWSIHRGVTVNMILHALYRLEGARRWWRRSRRGR